MGDLEEILRRGYVNGFDSLERSISALREHINVVKKEPNKVDIHEIDAVFHDVEMNEKACKINSDTYVKYLEENK